MSAAAVARSRQDFAELRDYARQHDPTMVQLVALVSCGEAKLRKPAPARQLYTSTLFRKSLEVAERLGDNVAILSAKHGLVAPSTVIRPYEQRLTSGAEAAEWADEVILQLEHAIADLPGRPVVVPVILAGVRYSDPLKRAISALGKRTFVLAPRCPIEGLEVGERLAMLTYQLGILPTKRGAA